MQPEGCLELKANLELSAEVWLDPARFTAPAHREQNSQLCSPPDKSGLCPWFYVNRMTVHLRLGTTLHVSAVFAASEEEPVANWLPLIHEGTAGWQSTRLNLCS